MSVFRNVVLLAAAAGVLAGLVMALMQVTMTAPLIQQAEIFENGANAAAGADHHGKPVAAAKPAGASAASTAAASTHGHGDGTSWAPADGLERTAYTVLANVVTAIGFALLLVVTTELVGGLHGWRDGLIWGFAGFAVFTLAPGLGLPPELPAMPTADLVTRQIWWLATVLATATGLALIVFQRHWALALLGAALIVAPHLVGAPQPSDHGSPVPPNLLHDFIVISTVTNLIFWMLLGALCGALREPLTEADETAAAPASA